MVDGQEQAATSEEKPDFAGTTLKKSFLELQCVPMATWGSLAPRSLSLGWGEKLRICSQPGVPFNHLRGKTQQPGRALLLS